MRRVVQTGDFTLVRYAYPPGATFRRHAHPEAQLTGVIRGRITFALNGTEHVPGPGDWLYIPGGGSANGQAGDHVLIAPPYTVSEAALDDLVRMLKAAVEETFTEIGRTVREIPQGAQ